MYIILVFLVLIFATQKSTEQMNTASTDVTLGVQERIALLKFQISQNIKKNRIANQMLQPIEQPDFGTSYEYIDLDNGPIKPINDDDERKLHGRYRLKQLRTTTEKLWVRSSTKRTKPTAKKSPKTSIVKEKIVADDISSSSIETMPKPLKGLDDILNAKPKKDKLRHLKRHKSNEAFYRRIFTEELKAHCAKESIHCQDLITPFLTGQKVNMTDRKEIKYSDHKVTRLIQLINLKLDHKNMEEINAVLYQVSNVQIRLFQWDVSALKLLLKAITKEPVQYHTFRTLKHGIKRLLNSWHLNLSNVTNLLNHARLFRPPCIHSDLYEGSTMSTHVVRYTKPKPKKKCLENYDENSDSCEP